MTFEFIEVSKQFEFESAHKLEGYADGAPNTCGNLHGHSYKLVVTVVGSINPETGMVIDFKDLSKIVKENVINKLDHSFMNQDYPEIGGELKRPTAENILIWIWTQLQPKLKSTNHWLWEIKLNETSNSWATLKGVQS
jgi:6-pyruvoyltetrahydropterin/6-carboxytetrahydropterin synthase